MKSITSAKDYIAKVQTAHEFLTMPSNTNSVSAYDLACQDPDKLENKGIQVCNLLDNLEKDDIIGNLETNHSTSVGNMTLYGEYIKRGASILSFDAVLDSDVGCWDIDRLATIGLNTSNQQHFDNRDMAFDETLNLWLSTDGSEYPFSQDTGEPRLPS